MYINLLTDDYIPEDAIVREDANGLTYYENGSWKFLSKDEYDAFGSSSGVTSSTVNVTTVVSPMDEIIEANKNTQSESYRYYTNYFGLNSFVTADKAFESTSGAVSDAIEIDDSAVLKLHADMLYDPAAASIEFSILDGNKEYPILPVEQKSIQHEKVFFMQPQRFRGKDKLYYRDGTSIGTSMDDASMANGALYTVSYAPADDSYSVEPKGTSVRIKTIIRVYDKDAAMPEISNIHLEKEAAG